MPKVHSAEIDILGRPADVWAVLVDTDNWPKFDPYCDRIEGRAAPGQTIKAFTSLAPGRAFPVKVVTFDAPKTMVWKGGMPLGLFTGVRTYSITTPSPGHVRFNMTEVFSGAMLGLFAKSLPDMTEPFAAFCKGLKTTVEAKQ